MKKIKSRTEYTTPLDPENKEAGNTHKSSYLEYDKKGNIICFKSYKPDETIDSRISTKFDETGNIIEEINYSNEKEFTDKTVYSRNHKGKIEQIEIFYPYDNSTIKKYLWHKDNKKLEIVIADSDGDIEEKEIIIFDNNNNPIEKLILDHENKFTEKIVYKYDENNNMIHKMELDKKDKIIIQDKLYYDENNNVIQSHKLNRKNKLLEKIVFQYNKDNKPLIQNFNNQHIISFSYDEKGNPVKEERKNMHGLTEHEGNYSYDENELLIEEKNLFEIRKYKYKFFEEN